MGAGALPAMKIRTKEELHERLDEELAWRRKELTSLSLDAQAADGPKRDALVRSGIALLYAHWEGFIRCAIEYYLNYVRSLRLTHDQLAPCLLGLAFQRKIGELAEASSISLHVDFAAFVREQAATRAALPESISMRSNLSSSVLRDVLAGVGVDFSYFELKEQLIDQRLVKARNEIAHGQHLCPPVSEFVELQHTVDEMLVYVRDAVEDCAQASRYLASVDRTPPGPHNP